ncbi:MAG: DUF3943 domain-containing protein, partial [Bradymonadaceae bacterium]
MRVVRWVVIIFLIGIPVAGFAEEEAQSVEIPETEDELCPLLLRLHGECAPHHLLILPTTAQMDASLRKDEGLNLPVNREIDRVLAPPFRDVQESALTPSTPWPLPELSLSPPDSLYLPKTSWSADTSTEPLARPPSFTDAAPDETTTPWRASLELVGALGLGTAWYWSNTDLNSLDWDYTLTFESQRRRHMNLSGWRFDDNVLPLNSPGHPLAGGSFYALARANNLSMPASFVAAMLTGMAWEILVEYK